MISNFYFTSTGPENLFNSSKAITDNGYLYNLQYKSCDPKLIKEKPYKHTSDEEKVNHPSHYTWLKDLCGIEVIDITRHMNFNLGQILKYILRLGHKKDKNFTNYEKVLSDLNKAKYYLENEINRVDKLCKKCGNH